MTGFLASVRDMNEAALASAAGADIVDLKAPERGALGALDVGEVTAIVRHLPRAQQVSATIGDLPLNPQRIAAAVKSMAETGVDYVKIGLFPGGELTGTLRALEPLARSGVRLVAVLFGDQQPFPTTPARLAEACFFGCMLDTADKTRGTLTRICSPESLAFFVSDVRSAGLLCGLAGSLTTQDIPDLLTLKPDYLGFRGALCLRHQRAETLDQGALRAIGAAVKGVQEVTEGTPTRSSRRPASPPTTVQHPNP
jgi:uncharacterized protein (UPF0264 family)